MKTNKELFEMAENAVTTNMTCAQEVRYLKDLSSADKDTVRALEYILMVIRAEVMNNIEVNEWKDYYKNTRAYEIAVEYNLFEECF